MLLLLLAHVPAQATHLRAGEITVERVNCASLTFKITITVYTNTQNTNVLFGGDQDALNFGDGSPLQLVPQQNNVIRTDLDPSGAVATASYTTFHTYSGPGRYTISYREANRNAGVLNMSESVNTTFYLETVINIDPFLGCNNSPKLLVPPIDHACVGAAWTHNPGAYDPDTNYDDSLSYSLEIPFSDRNTTVVNYRPPNDQSFYTNFNTGNEAGVGRPTFSIDPITGTITWDSPGRVGEYNIAFHVIEWRKLNGQWVQLGYVRRDMQIIVDNDCINRRPDIEIPLDTCVVAGTLLKATVTGTDPDNNPVKIEAFSEIFNFLSNKATYSPVPGVNDFRPQPAQTTFTWQTDCDHVKDQPYQVVFKVTDRPNNNGTRLVTYKTWFIRVVGPPPVWNSATLNTGKRTASLDWETYTCDNAVTMQIWRKVDGSGFTPDNCQTGMPASLGYELINTVPIATTSYVDTNNGKGLSPAAKYCYRLVAVFPSGAESLVSQDICVGPLKADVPIMTNVSVLKTDQQTGEIEVKWVPPFEADPGLYPAPYTYDVYRAIGFVRGADSVRVATGLSATSFIDAGLNTEDNVYNYSVVAFSSSPAPDNRIGSSAAASSVRASARSAVKKIELSWSAFVPWSNVRSQEPRKHLIYRGESGAKTLSNLVLIDSVEVMSNGFMYVDEGKYNNQPLEDGKEYCYAIMTRGGYGNNNPVLLNLEPLRNFSQIICAQPGDTIPPCKPVLSLNALDCNKFSAEQKCRIDDLSTTLFWSKVREDQCDTNILGYKIYRASSENGTYTWLSDAGNNGIVVDTFYVDNTGSSVAYCYKLSAVDRSLNESELSDPVCNNNCPYYELPNIFTPNGDKRNELFSAYSDRLEVPADKIDKCARFVEEVNFKVYNRWGQEVYSYRGRKGDELNNIYIDWNGRASNGSDLAAGIYYYIAEVTFDIVSDDKTKIIKGWVHLMK